VAVELGQRGATVRHESTGARWQFSDPDDTWTVVLAQDSLAIETRAYRHFADFLERLRTVLRALVEHVQPQLGTRLGLRYVNEIRPTSLDWRQVVRSELLGPLSVPEIVANTRQVQCIQQLALRYDEYLGVNINHGLFPGGTTVRPRAGTLQTHTPFYLLDFDVFRAPPRPAGLAMDPDAICDLTPRRLAYRTKPSRLPRRCSSRHASWHRTPRARQRTLRRLMLKRSGGSRPRPGSRGSASPICSASAARRCTLGDAGSPSTTRTGAGYSRSVRCSTGPVGPTKRRQPWPLG
jgi:uncharacterized protein (TIGR04255 family)